MHIIRAVSLGSVLSPSSTRLWKNGQGRRSGGYVFFALIRLPSGASQIAAMQCFFDLGSNHRTEGLFGRGRPQGVQGVSLGPGVLTVGSAPAEAS
jgi:hypothetical protein